MTVAAFLVTIFLVLMSAIGHHGGHKAILGKEKVTNLHFYFHETVSGKDPTSVLVARPNGIKNGKVLPYGSIFVFGNPLKEGADPNSKLVGNAQGLAALSSKDRKASTIGLDFGFTTGKFNGSSVSLFSRDPISKNPREVAVVGGRGKFQYGRSSAIIRTEVFNPSTGDGIYEVNLTVLHYEVK